MKRSVFIITTLLLGLILLPNPLYAYIDTDETIIKQGQIDDDYYAAGGKVTINADVAGDVVVAGGDLSINSRITDDLTAAGGSVSIRGSVQDDIRVAGGEIDIEAVVGDDLMATGGDIAIEPTTIIHGDTRLAGGDITVAGTIQGDLAAAGASLKIAGTILGDVEYKGNKLQILDGARIEGDLKYQSHVQAMISPNATISGDISYEEKDWNDNSRGFGFFFAVTMIVTGILFLLLFPNYTVESAKRIGAEPLKSIGFGLLLFVFTPIIAILFMSIVIGIWVGLTVLALYAVALLAGYLISCIFVGDLGARLLKKDLSSRSRRIISVVLAILLLAVVAMVPLLGGLLIFILLLSGLGAGVLQLNFIYRQPI